MNGCVAINLKSALLAALVSLLLVSPALAQFSSGTSTSTGKTVGGNSGPVWVHPVFGTPITGRPVGTSTGESPVYYGGGGSTVWGLGGAPAATGAGAGSTVPGAVGQFGYYNNNGMGYYAANPMMQQFPIYPAPVELGDNYYAFGGLSARLGYWRAQSGFYYPWCPPVYLPGVVYPSVAPIYMMDQSGVVAARPPIGIIIEDTRLFIESAKSKKQLDQSSYENLFNTLNEIAARTAESSARGGGSLNADAETQIRRDLDLLSAQIARSLSP